ncbi:MAG: PIN domain-containing protein [Balneolaceae bacterium]|nr:PIN domain-containing protein [Balneolaceae bacterium]
MSNKKVLIDTNVCLDAILKRTPFAMDALRVFELSEVNKINGFVSSHCIDTLFYILNQTTSKESSYLAIEALRELVEIAPVNQSIIDASISAKWTDFEDAITYYTALGSGCDTVITRNAKDFKQAKIDICTPEEFLEKYN